MSRATAKILPFVQLTRLALVFTAISNIWMIVFWARAVEGEPTLTALPAWEALGLTAGVAVGLYVFGMTLNDVMDVRRDRLFAPQRPLPAGRVSLTNATLIAVVALLLALACTLPLGTSSTVVALLCAGLIVFYDATGKYLPAIGLITLGLVRATHMLIADPGLAFCWPVWLTMTHVVLVSSLAYVLERKRPRLVPAEGWMVLTGWAFWSLVLIFWMARRDGLTAYGMPGLWVGPLAAVAGFAVAAAWMIRRSPSRHQAGATLMRLGLTWLIVYDAAWMASAGLWLEAAILAGLLVAAIVSVEAVRRLKQIRPEAAAYEPDRRLGL